VVGVALLIWVMVEIGIIGYSNEPPLQATYLLLGIAITVVALAWLAEALRFDDATSVPLGPLSPTQCLALEIAAR